MSRLGRSGSSAPYGGPFCTALGHPNGEGKDAPRVPRTRARPVGAQLQARCPLHRVKHPLHKEMVIMALSSLWRRLSGGSWSPRPLRGRRFRPSVEALEDRYLLVNRFWVGLTDGLWSAPANWNPAGIPQNVDNVIFSGAAGVGNNTNSKMDLGGGTAYHIAGLEIRSSYTKTITLQSHFYVDVLEMYNGTIDTIATPKVLFIWQKALDPDFPATRFGTSSFAGGRSSPTRSQEGRMPTASHSCSHRMAVTPRWMQTSTPTNSPPWSGDKAA